MDLKGALILLSVLISFGAMASVGEVSEALQKKDWPSLILLLKPLQGQNFEQDLILAKAYLSLERRTEAIQLLAEMGTERKDDRVIKLRDLASTQFFAQETANLYYEAIRFISSLRWSEAKERLDQALAKEPGQGLVLLRLVQLDLETGSKDLEEHLRLALESIPDSVEAKIFLGRTKFLNEDPKEAARIFSPWREVMLRNEVSTVWWLDLLSKTGRHAEGAQLQKWILDQHPTWSFAMTWFLKADPKVPYSFSGSVPASLIAQLKKNLKDPSRAKASSEIENKKSQYFWVGYFTDETLKLQLEQWLRKARLN